MKLLVLSLFFIAAFPMWAMAGTEVAESNLPVDFYRARTEPEVALDAILNRDKEDTSMFEYLTHPSVGIDNADYASMFTIAFRNAVVNVEAHEVQKNCGGKYIKGELCGLDFSPVTCAQDVSDTFYLYHTRQANKREAIIAYAWPHASRASAIYRLLKEDGNWKLDGVVCAGGVKFNME